MSDADLCKCGHHANYHNIAGKSRCHHVEYFLSDSTSCPCTAFSPAPAQQDEPCDHILFTNTHRCTKCGVEVPSPASEVPDLRDQMIQAVVNVEKDYLAGKYPTGSVVSAVVDTVIMPLLTIDPAGIECVLAEHPLILGRCHCGYGADRTFGIDDSAHRAHVAAAVVEYLHRKEQSE